MKVIIIEDELTAVQKLSTMLFNIDPGIKVAGSLESVKESVQWFNTNPAPNLAFVDVQLSDDTSFEIFKQVNVKCPVIFTTAYDQYILESFEYNSIDYLLKPIQEDRLKKALEKVKKLETHFLQHRFNQIFQGEMSQKESYKKRFLVKKGVDHVSVNTREIAYFLTAHKIVFLIDKEGKKYIIDKTLSDLEKELNPVNFFRANRKYLVSIDAIDKFKSDSGKIALYLNPDPKDKVTVSKENASNFKQWIEG